MSFAALEVRTNAATMRHLRNATATIVLPAEVAGEEVVGIFDAAYQVIDQGSGVQSSAPVFTADEPDMPAALISALAAAAAVTLQIRGDTYSVIEPQPDGTGFHVMRLRKP
jgi:hypothetical protein